MLESVRATDALYGLSVQCNFDGELVFSSISDVG